MNISHEKAMQQAQECIAYYEPYFLSQQLGQNWALGLFMARQWQRMLQQEKPDLEEVRLFSTALNNDWGSGGCGGSQWCSMALQVGLWLKSLEQLADEEDV